MKCARGAAPSFHLTIGHVAFSYIHRHPPSDAEFPTEVAEKFGDGQPWHKVMDGLLDVDDVL